MQLVGLKGLHWTHTFPLEAPEVSIGREVGNTIVCDGDSRVSRRHARLVPVGLTYAVEDLGSANGTFVNGVRIAGQTLLNNGDEIRIGGQSYRFEGGTAAPTMAPPPSMQPNVPLQPREVSRSERAKGYTPGTERIYSGGGGLSDLSGCSMPNLPDLSGCLRILLLLLIALVVLMVVGGLLMLLGAGIGALFGGAGAGGGGAMPAGGGSHGGQQSQGGDQNGRQSQGEGIHIESVRVAMTWHAALRADAPRALVTWDNFTKGAVHEVWATVISRDAQGQVLATKEDVVIYNGKPVEAAGTHEDSSIANEGFDPPGKAKPAVVDVQVTKYE